MIIRNQLRILIPFSFCILAFFCQGCATLKLSHFIAAAPQRPEEYRQFYARIDASVIKNGTADASTFQVKGFPYLRANRFLLGLRKKAITEPQKQLWLEWMRQMDVASRIKEINNLPDSVINELTSGITGTSGRNTLIEKTKTISETLLREDQKKAGFYEAVGYGLRDTDGYSTIMRAIGLYPVFSLPVAFVTSTSYSAIHSTHASSIDNLKTYGELTAFAPETIGSFNAESMPEIFLRQKKNLFNVPELTNEEIDKLALALAPVIYQDVAADYDRFGKISWKKNHVSIEEQNPIVYYYPSYAFIKGAPVLQINYTLWYNARAGKHAPWIERGPLDGLTIRVTLDTQGNPIMMDIMNNCGCYHFFVPRKEKISKITSHPIAIDPLVPDWLPEDFPEKRVNLFVNTGWHQVDHIFTKKVPAKTASYTLVPYDILESLPHEDGHKESVFNRYGIMKNSSRIEPYIFFFSGIYKIGYMRQRGNHAVKIVGRENFTDPEIFDKNFSFK